MSLNQIHDWHYNASKLIYALPGYRYSLITRSPRDLVLVPPDSWPGNAERGVSILNKEFSFFGETVRGDLPTWRPGNMSEKWLAELHGFDWIRDLRALGGDKARQQARNLVNDWLKRQSNWHEVAWRPDVIGNRVFCWLGQHDFFCDSADDEYRKKYFSSLVRQSKHLSRTLPRGTSGSGLILATKGLITAGLLLPGHSSWVSQGLRALDRACSQQILADGGHVSRNPLVQTQVLRHLVDIRTALLATQNEIPTFLMASIDRAAPFLRMLRHNDGSLALFNGGSESPGWLIDHLLAQANSKGRALNSAPHSGYERFVANRAVLIMDTSSPQRGKNSLNPHASTLAIEFSVGKERIIVNCGARLGASDSWSQVERSTAAHSTMVVDDTNSSEIFSNKRVGRRPDNVKVDRKENNGSLWINASHDGYRPIFGLIHNRRIYINSGGDDIRGEDLILKESIGKRTPRGYSLRFHLHPSVQVSLLQNGNAALLRLPSGLGWRFVAEGGTMSLAESIYLGGLDEVRRSEQIVLSGLFEPVDPSGVTAKVKWALKKVPKRS